ncbi:MAG: hypothetical protein V2A34_05455, partial [Lentisphaerota bacterium]
MILSRQKEAGHAVKGAVHIGLGQAASAAIGLVSSMFITRVLGSADYGNWVLFRSIISIVVGFSLMGTPEVMARFFVAPLAEGKRDEAGRVFKVVALFRMLLFGLAAGAGFFLLLAADYSFASAANAFYLAASVVFQGWITTFVILLYCE